MPEPATTTAETVLRAHPWIGTVHRGVGDTLVLLPEPGLLASRPVAGGLATEFLDQWIEVYDWTYRQARERRTADLDLSGWRATDTGKALPAEHMADWAQCTVDLVLRSRPRRVFEIGCGTGMLAHRLRPVLDGYVGCDPSEVAVTRLRDTGPPGIGLVRAAAHEITTPEVGEALDSLRAAPDCVLLNSVTECFPDLDYLRAVLTDAIGLVAAGGTVVVGDIRHAGLLDAYCRWAERAADPDVAEAELVDRAARRAGREEELLIDPATLAATVATTNRVVRLAVHARPLRADTELSRYRFDAVLHIDPPTGDPPPPGDELDPIGWAGLDADRLGCLRDLVRQRPVRVTGIPNRLLRSEPGAVTPFELRDAVHDLDAVVLLDPYDPTLLQLASPAATATDPAAALAGPGLVHQPLAGFARQRLLEVARRALQRAGTAAPTLDVELPRGTDPRFEPAPELAAAADRAGRDAIARVDQAALPTAMRRLDGVALLAMAVTIREQAGLPTTGEPARTADEVIDALRVAQRHRWIVHRWLMVLTAEGWLTRDDAGRYRDLRAAGRDELAAAAATLDGARRNLGYPPELTRFFRTAIDHLPELLRDEIPLQALLFPDGEVTTALGTYQDNTINRYLNGATAEVLRYTAPDHSGPLRVLELGAGVGGTTATVLAALDSQPVDYLFTDVSRYFLDVARERFAAHPTLRYGLLDINGELPGQDVPPGSVDVVLAANVLHNAHHIGEVLHRLRELLAPGGRLAIVESCREHYQAMTSMQFLMSPRTGRPRAGVADVRAATGRIFLTRAEWRGQLTAAGLSTLLDLPRPDQPLAALGQHLFLATPVITDRRHP